MRKLALLATILSLSGLFYQNAMAGNLYRFKIDGRTELKDYIPPEYSRYGYDVLNNQGVVIKRVPRAPTPEEILERKAREQAEKLRKEEIAELEKNDRRLLKLYATPGDVERARLRKVEEVNTYIALQNRRLASLKIKLKEAEGRAVRFREGGNLPNDIATELAELNAVIDEGNKDILDREEEIKSITKTFANEAKRLKILQKYPPGTLEEDVDFSTLN
ncbi:MAG: hypothetical protein ACPGYX_03250 [Oceanobacter sp.]